MPWQPYRYIGVGRELWHREPVGVGAPAMIPKLCGLCKQQRTEKPASLYWAWTAENGRRKAYKQKVCVDCMRDKYVPLIAASEEPVLICPACGMSTVDDYEAVYLTYCLPGMPPGQSEMPLCAEHATIVRAWALEGASLLPDRQQDDSRGVGVGGPRSYAPDSKATWDALGLAPQRRDG